MLTAELSELLRLQEVLRLTAAEVGNKVFAAARNLYSRHRAYLEDTDDNESKQILNKFVFLAERVSRGPLARVEGRRASGWRARAWPPRAGAPGASRDAVLRPPRGRHVPTTPLAAAASWPPAPLFPRARLAL